MPPKSRATAILLSLVVPGLGHVYLGALARALLFLGVAPIGAVVLGLAAPEASPSVMFIALFVVLGLTRLAAAGDTLLVPREKHRSLPTAAIVGLVLGGLVAAQLTAFALRKSVMEAYKVPSGAMMPSVLVGDHFFADKIVYGKRDPRRGEIVVFKYPEHPEQDFVKRAIGIAGDEILVRGKTLLVNGWEVPHCKVGTWSYEEQYDGTKHSGELYVEYLDDAMYYVFFDENGLASEEQGPYRVKPGETFMMGDNRHNAHDSRMWFGGTGGGVPRDHVKGRARLLWLSPAPGRAGGDLAELGPPPTSGLAEAVKRCVAERPPRTKTSPPSSPRGDR